MSYFFISGIAIAIFLFAVLIAKPEKKIPDYMLAALLFFAAQSILNTFLAYKNLYILYPDLFVFGFGSPLNIGPLLFLYTSYQTKNIEFQKRDLLHFLPYVIISLLHLQFYFLPLTEKENIMRLNGKGYETINFIRIICIYISGLVYSLLSLWLLLRFRKGLKNEFSNTEKIQFNWLLFLITAMLCIWIIVLFLENDNITSFASTTFIILLGYFGFTQVNVFSKKNVPAPVPTQEPFQVSAQILAAESIQPETQVRYQHSNLNEKELLSIHEQLTLILQKEKPYLDAELTLNDLARLVKTHPNKLSQAINQVEQKSFYDLINEMRIRDFLHRLSLPENKQYTLMSIAYDSGFNSKASFNRNFKKHTGKTPSEYLEQNVGEEKG